LFDRDRPVVTAPPGAGSRLIDEARQLVPTNEMLWAQVAPGNAASLRAFLRCGFRPIGAEVLIEPEDS
jgi:RimJ/RimL family protein N-acetyltransferase